MTIADGVQLGPADEAIVDRLVGSVLLQRDFIAYAINVHNGSECNAFAGTSEYQVSIRYQPPFWLDV